MCTISLYHQLKQILTQSGMDEREASAITLMLIEEKTGLSRTQILTSAATAHCADLLPLAQQVARGVPVQYVLGYAYFCGMKFRVTPSVLIPRPETEELVEWVISSVKRYGAEPRILDVGTGSGCIAITLAKRIPSAHVTALDISAEALQVARRNAEALHAEVRFQQLDILHQQPQGTYDLIVSNPPYVCESEKATMERNVLDHEPHLALFVPDATPLLFYEAIARQALTPLTPNGQLYFEINRLYGTALTTLLHSLGYTDIQLRRDHFGNDRMIKAIKL